MELCKIALALLLFSHLQSKFENFRTSMGWPIYNCVLCTKIVVVWLRITYILLEKGI